MTRITARPLTREAFAPFGDVIETLGAESFLINDGKCRRFHDLAKVEAAGGNARVLINIFRGQPYSFPHQLKMVERHPFGSQAFMPLAPRTFLVAVCPDEAGKPGMPQAFITRPGQGVNYARNTWHAVLTPIGEEQDFLVIDRGGEENNLEEYFFNEPYEIHLPEQS
ncbi:ureidoglycolate lyase [Chelativorans sp. YIM 93263]|uniref:ureidoglycolate lyase n=1 Tax=Chelativorans sp. YIM 93263 TaxID=2906648 RepID=UPI002379A2E2|nr:ureidoglycolate lyase [Chelativorans sp. YIM 93263]